MAFIDRVVQYPNRVVMTPVTGQSNTYDMTRAEGTVTEAGTPLNAANLNGEIADAIDTAMTAFTIDGNNNVAIKNLQGGRVSTTVAAKTTKSITVTFPQAFDTVPFVVVTPRSSTPTQLHTTVGGVTTTGFTLYAYGSIARACNVDWIALAL